MKIGIAGSGLFAGGSFQSNEFMAGVSSEGKDIARTCRKAAVPLALMHQFRWRALSPDAFRPHSPRNSCSLRSSRPSTGKANNISPGALTRIGLRACSSAKARLTLRCSSLPNRAEFAGECAAFIYRTFFYWARSWNTESPEIIPLRNQMDFWDRLVDSIIDNSREPNFTVQLSNFPTRKFASSDTWESFVEQFRGEQQPLSQACQAWTSCSARCAPGRWTIS